MSLYLYALANRRPRGFKARGVGGKAARVIEAKDFAVALSDAPVRTEPTLANLRAHDRVVRRLAQGTSAVLPLRFGTRVEDEAELKRLLSRRGKSLKAALTALNGRVQFALRIVGPRDAAAKPAKAKTGAAFLRQRAARHRVPELEEVVAVLRPWVKAERAERPAQGPVVGAVFHLVDRADARAYVAAVKRAPPPRPPLRLLTSGPGPGWAFAPGVFE